MTSDAQLIREAQIRLANFLGYRDTMGISFLADVTLDRLCEQIEETKELRAQIENLKAENAKLTAEYEHLRRLFYGMFRSES